MNATESLAQFIADTSYDRLPGAVVEAAKIAILDGVSTMVAGSAQDLAVIIGEYVKELGGAPRSSVVGWGFKTNAPSAAFANGVFGHCLDFEIQGYPPTHGTSSCLPAALALSEGQGVSGKTLIEAYVVGWEIQGRLRAASAKATNPAFHPPGLVGPFGGAAAGAKVLGINPYQTRMAIGIAASRTGGLTANTGTMVKSTHPGNAARMGVEAAMLARAGYTANEEVLEAPNGYAAALFQGDLEWEILTKDLGRSYRLVDPGFDVKRFPAQIHMQNPVQAVLDLCQRHGLQANMVDSITIEMRGRGHSGPLPKSGLDGKFSVEYCAALALLDGHVGIDSFTDQRRFSPDMEDTLRKVRVESRDQGPGVVRATAQLKDGRTLSEECQGYRGSAHNPMSRQERLEKVRACLRRVLADQDLERLIALLEDLEKVADVTTIMDVLGQKPPVKV